MVFTQLENLLHAIRFEGFFDHIAHLAVHLCRVRCIALGALEYNGAYCDIEVDMILQNIGADATTDFTFTVHRNDFETALDLLQQTAANLGARESSGNNRIVKLSIVGVGMRSHAGIASKMFEILANEGINILMISTSEIKISVVVDEKYLELGVRALHDGFDLAEYDEEATE